MPSNLPFFLLLSLLPFFSSSLLSNDHTNLVQTTCNATTYYDFCISSLSSSPQIHNATTTKSLSAIAVTLALANATNTSSFASALSKTPANSPALSALLRTCADKYARACEALRWSIDAISEDSYDYAFVQVSAAAEYPDVCRVLFRQSAGVAYPVELAKREEVMDRLCSVALEIISLLG